jgi:hypothetical protein
MRRAAFLLFWILSSSTAARAEYRAFELVLTDPTTGQEKVVVSTLDPWQYVIYHPVGPQVQVIYRSTWMCRGNTSNFKPICPNPKAQ